jgi:hypothetical protein
VEIGRAIDHHDVLAVADLGEDIAPRNLQRPVGQVRIGDVEGSSQTATEQEVDDGDSGRSQDLVGDRFLLVGGGDRLGRSKLAGYLRTEEALREARLLLHESGRYPEFLPDLGDVIRKVPAESHPLEGDLA